MFPGKLSSKPTHDSRVAPSLEIKVDSDISVDSNPIHTIIMAHLLAQPGQGWVNYWELYIQNSSSTVNGS